MIDIKEAANAAKQFVRDFYADAELKALHVDEIKLSNDERYWEVTVGFTSTAGYRISNSSGLFAGMGSGDVVRLPRDLKLVKVDVESGRVSNEIVDRSLSG